MNLTNNPLPIDTSPLEDMTYEQAFSALETLVENLESQSLSLEQAMQLFERGQALAHHCALLLDQAELKVQQLTGEDLAVPRELRPFQEQD